MKRPVHCNLESNLPGLPLALSPVSSHVDPATLDSIPVQWLPGIGDAVCKCDTAHLPRFILTLSPPLTYSFLLFARLFKRFQGYHPWSQRVPGHTAWMD